MKKKISTELKEEALCIQMPSVWVFQNDVYSSQNHMSSTCGKMNNFHMDDQNYHSTGEVPALVHSKVSSPLHI